FPRETCDYGKKWLARMHAEKYRNLHLVFSTLYGYSGYSPQQSNKRLRWLPRESSALDDECFIWPLTSSKRGMRSRGDFGEGTLSNRYLVDLLSAREGQLAGKAIDLSFDEKRVRDYIHELIRSHALFGSKLPLFLVDIRLNSEHMPSLSGVLKVTADRAIF